MSMKQAFLVGAAAVGCLPGSMAFAQSAGQRCDDESCRFKVTPQELLQSAEQLVSERRFQEAAPLLAALENAPELSMQRQFLLGYSAVETGDTKGAIKAFRSALAAHPEQTRIRLELARALMLEGKSASADHHFRLAAQDKELPEEVLKVIRGSRTILRNQRQWSFNFNLGFAPDTNITNGTNASTIDANFGGNSIPLTLSSETRQRSGIGQTMGMSGTGKLDLGGENRLVIDGDVQTTNYKGKKFDDIGGQISVGPSFELSNSTSVTVQGLASQRYFGGRRVATALGARANLQLEISDSQRLGVLFDARHSQSGFARSYTGWQYSAYATYERVVARSLVATANIFGRREALRSSSYSNTEFGANLGIGGELPKGITAGVSAGVSRAVFDAPLSLFSLKPRNDTRFNARATVGLRSLRVLGFSPSVTYTYTKSASSLTLYDSSRHRVAFSLARYF